MCTVLGHVARGGVAVVLLSVAAGCGSPPPPARPDIAAIPVEELHGQAVKQQLHEFRVSVYRGGVRAARGDLPGLLEEFEGYEDRPVGEHLETYKQIWEKLKALETTLAGSPSKQQVAKAVNEIAALANTLPEPGGGNAAAK